MSALHYKFSTSYSVSALDFYSSRNRTVKNITRKPRWRKGYLRAVAPSFQDGSILYPFRDIAAHWSKIATPLYLSPLLGVKPWDLRNDRWWRKTRMIGLSDGEIISMICSAVLVQYTRVTDRQTDGQTDGQTKLAWHIRAIAYMLSRVKIGPYLPKLFYTVSKKNRTPMICLNNSNKSNPILMIFGTKYRHIIFFYWNLLFCDTQ